MHPNIKVTNEHEMANKLNFLEYTVGRKDNKVFTSDYKLLHTVVV